MAKNNNEDFKNTFEFYKESKWILKDDLVIVLLLLHSETYQEIYMFGKLNNFPQKNHERTKSIIFRLKDKNFKIQILKDEYYVDVTLLTQDGQLKLEITSSKMTNCFCHYHVYACLKKSIMIHVKTI